MLNKLPASAKIALLSLIAISSILSIGCDPAKQSVDQNDGTAGNQPLQIIATTGQINDALQQITSGTGAKIKLFCGPGVDPHSFSASSADVQAMLDADLIFYNGFHLEAKLSEHLHGTFENKSWAMASAFPKEARLDWVEDGQIDDEAPFDPHIWNHLPAWGQCVTALAEKLAATDTKNADKYKSNATSYVTNINETHAWAEEALAKLPADRRTIVSAHDAFKYFAKVYQMEALAVLGIGNDAEADIQTMRSVAGLIAEKKIPAIFMESITNPKVTQALQEACAAKDWKVKLVDQPLYSDDLGEAAPQNTFLGAFRSNVEIISSALNESSAAGP